MPSPSSLTRIRLAIVEDSAAWQRVRAAGIELEGESLTRAPAGFAPLGIGLCLTLIHLVTIPITNTSVNPARSIGPALFTGGEALEQVWLFIVAPIAGAVLAALAHRFIAGSVEPAPPAEIS